MFARSRPFRALGAAFFCLTLNFQGIAQTNGEPPLPPRHTGLLYMSGSLSNNIGEYLPDGTLVRTISVANMKTPRGVAVDANGNLVVSNQGSDRIQIIDQNGVLLGTVQHADLNNTTGLARSAQGDWYIGNFSPAHVVIFDADWNYKSTLTATGMAGVNCVAFDADGGFAVSSASTNSLFLFDANQQFLQTVSHATISSPMSIAVDSLGNHFVSNGGGTVVTQFDSAWNYVRDFGNGYLTAPQGIAIDENDVLTVTNFVGGQVYRFDNQGNYLSDFPATGLTMARNISWQYAPAFLARKGAVAVALGQPQAVLTVNGSSGDAHGLLELPINTALTIDLTTSASGPNSSTLAFYVWAGEAGPAEVIELTSQAGLFAFPLPPGLGSGWTMINSIGLEPQLGTGIYPPVFAPGQVLDLPAGIGTPGVYTLQAILQDDGAIGGTSFPWSASNAVVVKLY
jgi:streptogramin lyase